MNNSIADNTPLVSIIIPAFNRATLIGETLDSVLTQTYPHWECIVVDDGSTDNTLVVVNEYYEKDKRFKLYKRNRLPKGASTCRNIGIHNSKGKYLIFLDSDDLLKKTAIENRVKYMNVNSNLDFAVFQMQLFNKTVGDNESALWNIENHKSPLQRFLEPDSVWSITGPIWKKDYISSLGGFNENLACWQDVDISLKALFKKAKFKINFNLPPDCFCRRHSEDSISQNSLTSINKLESRKELYFWAYENTPNISLLKKMAISNVISAIKGFHIKFAITFLLSSKQKYTCKEYLNIHILIIIYGLRLYKTRPFSLVSLYILKGLSHAKY